MIISNLARPRNQADEKLTLPQLVEALNLSSRSTSGQSVTAETSRSVATAYRAINILSDDLAKMPMQTFISREPGQVERVRPSSFMENIAWLLEISPNRWMVPLIFKKMAIQWLLTHGAAYIWSPPRQAGQRREMFCLASNRVAPLFDLAGNLVYRVTWRNGEIDYLPDVEILALLINSTDGITGHGVIEYARETLGRQLGAYETQGKFYAQGLNPGGIVYMPGDLSKEARDKIRETYGEAMGGSQNAYRLAVMDAKITKFETITMKPVDAQFLESIAATDVQIANFFGMPLYKVNSGKQSYELNEQQDLDYLKTTLDPYLVQWEQAAAVRWLSEAEQNYTYFRFNRDVILRTDAKTRTTIHKDRILSGQETPNEARQIEDMPAYAGGDGHYIPANMAMVGPDGALIGGTKQSSGNEQGGTQT